MRISVSKGREIRFRQSTEGNTCQIVRGGKYACCFPPTLLMNTLIIVAVFPESFQNLRDKYCRFSKILSINTLANTAVFAV